jgi:anti-anti-sigma regulatory factor
VDESEIIRMIVKKAFVPYGCTIFGAGNGAEATENKPVKYFALVEDIVILTLPAKVNRPVSVEVEAKLQAKIQEMTGAQLKKMILDMGGVSETNLSLIKLIIAAFQQCQQASVAVRLVANPKQGEELKGFQETSQIAVSHSSEEAKAVL